MSALDEAENLVDDKFESKRNEVYQEFRVLVKVSPNSDDATIVRELLDRISKNFEDYTYADETGSLQVVQVEPK